MKGYEPLYIEAIGKRAIGPVSGQFPVYGGQAVTSHADAFECGYRFQTSLPWRVEVQCESLLLGLHRFILPKWLPMSRRA